MKPFVEVQFSGKPALYGYLIPGGITPIPGNKVVVPTGMKNDGKVSLSIATVVNVGETSDDLKPYAQLINPSTLLWAESESKRIDSGALTKQLEASLK